MSAMRLCLCGEQENASLFCVYSLRLPCKRGFGRSNKCIKGRTGPASLWKEWCSKAAVSRNPKRPAAALGYGRCRGGMESLSFMTRRMSKEAVVLWNARCKGLISTFEEETNKEEPNGSFMFPPPHNGLQTPQNRLTQKY